MTAPVSEATGLPALPIVPTCMTSWLAFVDSHDMSFLLDGFPAENAEEWLIAVWQDLSDGDIGKTVEERLAEVVTYGKDSSLTPAYNHIAMAHYYNHRDGIWDFLLDISIAKAHWYPSPLRVAFGISDLTSIQTRAEFEVGMVQEAYVAACKWIVEILTGARECPKGRTA